MRIEGPCARDMDKLKYVYETELMMRKCNYDHTLGGLWVHTYLCLSTQEIRSYFEVISLYRDGMG